jgi:hypothetical protein
MKTLIIAILTLALLGTTACEVRMASSEYFSKLFRTQTDTKYYRGKALNSQALLTGKLTDLGGERD